MRTRSGAIGDELLEELPALVETVAAGAVDKVLVSLLGDELSRTVARTGINALVINPESTSTKVDVFDGTRLVARDEVHSVGKDDGPKRRVEQVLAWLGDRGLSISEVTAIAARGGFMRSVPRGTYSLTEEMAEDLKHGDFFHAANHAVPMALALGKLASPDVLLTVTDPVVCDEVDFVHTVTGSSELRTDGTGAHYLSLGAACSLVEKAAGYAPGKSHIVACHLGTGFSAVRYQRGKMAQIIPAFGGIPSGNRAGRLPLKDVLRGIRDGSYSVDDLRKEVVESGAGLLGFTGTNDFRALLSFRNTGASQEQRMKIDLLAEFYAVRTAAAILELSATSKPLDAIVLTGGVARDEWFCEQVSGRLHLGVPLIRIPGSIEAEALAAGALRACVQPESLKEYRKEHTALAERRKAEGELMELEIFKKEVSDHREGLAPSNIDELISAAIPRGNLPSIALAGADNEEALLAAKKANLDPSSRLAKFVLLGDYAKISQLAWELDVPIDDENFILVESEEPATTAVELLNAGLVDTIMKGSVTTSALLKAYFVDLKARGLTSKGMVMSHICMFDIPGRTSFVSVSDAAINPTPDLEARVSILDNALNALHLLGMRRPKVAVISATEKPSAKVVSSVEGKEIAERFADRDDVIIDGPISVDLSLSAESAREKGYKGKVQGDADLLLVPNLDSGNAVYKAFTTTARATAAGAVIGGEVPLILTSRGDSSRTKLASIALVLLLARRAKAGEGKGKEA